MTSMTLAPSTSVSVGHAAPELYPSWHGLPCTSKCQFHALTLLPPPRSIRTQSQLHHQSNPMLPDTHLLKPCQQGQQTQCRHVQPPSLLWFTPIGATIFDPWRQCEAEISTTTAPTAQPPMATLNAVGLLTPTTLAAQPPTATLNAVGPPTMTAPADQPPTATLNAVGPLTLTGPTSQPSRATQENCHAELVRADSHVWPQPALVERRE